MRRFNNPETFYFQPHVGRWNKTITEGNVQARKKQRLRNTNIDCPALRKKCSARERHCHGDTWLGKLFHMASIVYCTAGWGVMQKEANVEKVIFEYGHGMIFWLKTLQC